jgi:hypothetical protein
MRLMHSRAHSIDALSQAATLSISLDQFHAWTGRRSRQSALPVRSTNVGGFCWIPVRSSAPWPSEFVLQRTGYPAVRATCRDERPAFWESPR